MDGYICIINGVPAISGLTCVAECRQRLEQEEQQEQRQDDETERNQSGCAPHCEFTISEEVVTPQTFPGKRTSSGAGVEQDDDARLCIY